MSQNNLADYGFKLPVAVAGQLYDLTDNTVDSLTAATAFPFGVPVAQGANDETGRLVAAVTDKFLGVSIHTHSVENDGVPGYKVKDRMSVLRYGRIWVTAAVAVAKEDNAYVTATGTFTNVAATNILVGKFLTSAGIGALAVLQLR